MNKRKYVNKLSGKLGRLPAEDRDSAVQYYSELIDEMLDERRNWNFIMGRIGTPAEAAKRVAEEAGGKRRKKHDESEYLTPRRHDDYIPPAEPQYAPQPQFIPIPQQQNNPPPQYAPQQGQYAAPPLAQQQYVPQQQPYSPAPQVQIVMPQGPYIPQQQYITAQPQYAPPVPPPQQYAPPPQPAYAPPSPPVPPPEEHAVVPPPAQCASQSPAQPDTSQYAAPSKGGMNEWLKWYLIFGIITIPLTIGLIGGMIGICGGLFGVIAAGGALVLCAPIVFVASFVYGIMAQSVMVTFVMIAAAFIMGGVGLTIIWVATKLYTPVKLFLKKIFKKS